MARRRTGLQREEVWIEMPREYSGHPLCKQLTILKDEKALQDVTVSFGASGRVERLSGFLLSLLSPVWCARLCGEFSQGREQRVELEEDEAEALKVVIELGCGAGGGRVMRRGLEELLEVGRMADRYQVDEVRRAVEEDAVRHLRLETCLEMHTVCERSGLRLVEEACRRMALKRFEDLTEMDGFLGMGEEMLRSLLEDDRLECRMEETVFERVVRWMKGGGGSEVRGEGLLDAIRFPVMRVDYLMTSARSALGRSEHLERLVSEALVLKGLPAEERSKHVKYIGRNALLPRSVRGVRWGEYGEGRRDARRLSESSALLWSLADVGEWVCGGIIDGTISVWNKVSLEVERTLTGHTKCPQTLAVFEGWLVSGSDDHDIRVWDVRSGQCVRTLEGHTAIVCTIVVRAGMMLSGSHDKTMRVWKLEGAPSTWWCERTLTGRDDGIFRLAWWGSKAVCGGVLGSIRLWDLSTGECVQKLQGHTNVITALVVREGRLISASEDKSVREWCLESGTCMKVIQAYPAESRQYITSLTISGGKLVGGSWWFDDDGESESEVDVEDKDEASEIVVWDLDTWAVEQQLKQPVEQLVNSLLATEGEVWAAVDCQLVLWGRED